MFEGIGGVGVNYFCVLGKDICFVRREKVVGFIVEKLKGCILE